MKKVKLIVTSSSEMQFLVQVEELTILKYSKLYNRLDLLKDSHHPKYFRIEDLLIQYFLTKHGPDTIIEFD